MSTLKEALKPYDFIVNKKDQNKDNVFMVLHEDLHDVHVWKEGEPPTTIPKRMINFTYMKVNPKIIKVLYGETNNDNTQSVDSNSSSE